MKKILCIMLGIIIAGTCAAPIIYAAGEEAALAEAEAYLLAGVTVTEKTDLFTASDGTAVSIEWTQVYDNTISDEKGSYLNSSYLQADGSVTRPQWFEGTKKLKCNVKISAGGTSKNISGINVTMPPKENKPQLSAADLSNFIDIGNPQSEAVQIGGRTVKRMECVRDNGVQVRTIEGSGHTYRTLSKNGAMVVNMKCDPQKPNYLTVKLWGDDTGDTMLWVCDPESGYMNSNNTKQPSRNGIVDRKDWVELNFLNSSPQYNGGFIYSTYLIPEVYTKDREYVSLRIYSTGGNANYNGVSIKDQTQPSRGIYAVYMTQSSNFAPGEFEEVVGSLVPAAQLVPIPYDEQTAMAQKYIYDAVEAFKSWQVYGGDNFPDYMEGMITRSSGWQKKSAGDTDWKNAYYNSSNGILKQNLTPMNMFEVYALAYLNTDKLGEYGGKIDKADLLDRFVKGIDFLVRAQGSNGGFYSGSGWIGGPDRKPAGGNNLTGFGLRSAGKGICLLYSEIEKAGYLSGQIDSDADGSADTSRAAAWSNMLSLARDYLVSLDGAGHAPNQDMADIIAALRFEKALELMNSEKAWQAQGQGGKVEELLDIALGFKINLACSSYWVSPKGLILENFGSIQGGYSGDYGINALKEMSQLAEFAQEYYGAEDERAQKYRGRIVDAYAAADNFMFTANAQPNSEPTLYSEGIISNRNAYYPGTERYVLDAYAAVECKSDTALKSFDYFLKHNNISRKKSNYTPANTHFEDNILDIAEMLFAFDGLQAAMAEKNTDEYNYLMENDSITSYAWADEMGRNVVIKNGDDRIYIALNWRNPMHSTTYYNNAVNQNKQQTKMNNLARVHHKTSKYDKYGYAKIATKDWSTDSFRLMPNHYVDAFMYMDYGDYKIVMNSNNLLGGETNKLYSVPRSELGLDGLYKELISGKYYYFGESPGTGENGNNLMVQAATTMVFYKTLPNEDMPQVQIDYTKEELVGFTAGSLYEITVDGKTETAAAGRQTIKREWFGKNASIVKKGTEGITEDSEAQTIAIPRRQTAPQVSVTDTSAEKTDGKITAADFGGRAIEYKLKKSDEWQDSPGGTITGLKAGRYVLRYKAADGNFSSEEAEAVVDGVCVAITAVYENGMLVEVAVENNSKLSECLNVQSQNVRKFFWAGTDSISPIDLSGFDI